MDSDDPVPRIVPADLEPGTMVGEYCVKWKLGEGGMAEVFAATHPVIGKKAAIKVISPSLCADADCVERFVLEARAANEIGHPNIVDVFAFGQLPDGRRYFVMEWLQGEPLSRRIDHEPMKVGDCCAILEQMCDALEAAHEKGIVHRDLKPDNVFLVPVRGRGEQVKLLDFGIAKLIGRRSKTVRWRTEPDFVMGTPEYLSPEQARGRDVDHRTDVYALGVIAYEMLCGRVPFVAPSAIEIIHMQMHDTPPPMRRSGVPRALDRMIRKMLAKDPNERPSLLQVRCVLRELRAHASAELPQRFVPRARSFLFAAVSAVLVSGVALAGVALQKEPPSKAPKVAAVEQPSPPLVLPEPTPHLARSHAVPPTHVAGEWRVARKHPGKAVRVPGQFGMPLAARGGDYVLDPFAKRTR